MVGDRQGDRYYDERTNYFRDGRDDREMGAAGGNGNAARHSQEPDVERGNQICQYVVVYFGCVVDLCGLVCPINALFDCRIITNVPFVIS